MRSDAGATDRDEPRPVPETAAAHGDDRRLGVDRAVSTTLGYVITLGITAVLISGLLFAGGQLVSEQRETVAREQLRVAGQQLASGLVDADRLAGAETGGAVRVKVWLPDSAGGESYELELVPQSTPADQPNETVVVARSPALDISVNVTVRTHFQVAARSVLGGPTVITHRDVDGDSTRELVVEDADVAPPPEPDPSMRSHEEVVFVDPDTSELKSIAPDGEVTAYGVDARAIGPKQADLDGDGLREIPFVNSANELRLVDEAGEVQTLTSDAAYSPLQNGYRTLVAVGRWNGELSVFYMNVSDTGGNDEALVYRVGLDGDAEKVTVGGSGIEANAIAGVADYNDDGDRDLVYVGTSQEVWYVDDGSRTNVAGVGANNGIGVGEPRVMDAGVVAMAPIVGGSNDVKTLRYDGTTTSLTTGGEAEKTFVAAVDWVGDDALEVVFVDASTGELKYVRQDGTVGSVTNESGGAVEADPSSGAA